jgi:1-acyl-sn-glycerol-3-phosphate acyltransferase
MNEPDEWTYRAAADLGMSPVDRFKSVRREPGLISSIIYRSTSLSIRLYFALMHRLTVVGAENLPPDPPFVMIANHASHLDASVLASALPPRLRAATHPIAAGDVFFTSTKTSILSSLLINALPLWRKKVSTHALADLRQRLESGDCCFILFPEGARSRDGAMLPFKPGLGMLLAGTPVPVVPCRIHGAFEALRPQTRIPRPSRIRLVIGKPFTCADVTQDRAGWDEVTRRARTAVEALH